MLIQFVVGASGNVHTRPFPISDSRQRRGSSSRALPANRIARLFGVSRALTAICVFVIALALSSAARLSAQTSGSISGHVADRTGAVIPQSNVTLTNIGTSGVRTTATTGSGDYSFPDVPPATYRIQVTHAGFKTATSVDVELQVQQSMRQDFTLEVGQVTQSVTVEATGTLLQAENATLGTVVENAAINELPLNGRNYLSLVALSSNVNTLAPAAGQASARMGTDRATQSISVGGQRMVCPIFCTGEIVSVAQRD